MDAVAMTPSAYTRYRGNSAAEKASVEILWVRP